MPATPSVIIEQPLTVRHDRCSRSVRVTVQPGGEIRVTAPYGTPDSLIRRFLAEKADWLRRAVARQRRVPACACLPRDRRSYLRHKEAARALVCACLERHAPRYGLIYKKVFIKNLRRNWGSCSELGNLNFNYKLVLLPQPLAEYVVVHELCHLAVFNHSPRFWALVGQAIPDWRARRRALRKFRP